MKKNHLKIILSGFLLFTVLILGAQNYTWVRGSNAHNNYGVFGTPGVSSPANDPGGRLGASSWKDASGNFWLFGGYGPDSQGSEDFMNDLWKYSPLSNEWTWMGGDSITFQPGIYGTLGMPYPTNKPGSRAGAAAWTDASGNLWLFGGVGLDSFGTDAELNDLWKYDVIMNEWTWMHGSNLVNAFSVPGTQGTSAPANTPGSCLPGVAWTDQNGDFWLFGGVGNTANNYGYMQDLWKYEVSTNEWTWVNGSGLVDRPGIYGTLTFPSTANIPGARYLSSGWTDASGNLWLFGGDGFDASGTPFSDNLNDLWKYNISTNEWTWADGSNSSGQGGTYGTQGTPAGSNIPGARFGHYTWSDKASGDFYLFGGAGQFTSSSAGEMNDLWMFSTSTNQWVWLKGNNMNDDNGTYGTQGSPSTANTPGSRYMSAGWTDNSGSLWLFGGEGIPASMNDYGYLNDLWKLGICSAPALTLSTQRSTICRGESVILSATGAATYSWNTSQLSPSISVSPTVNTVYSVTGFNALGCSATALLTQNVSGCSGLDSNGDTELSLKLYPNPNNGEFTLNISSVSENTHLVLFNALGQKVMDQYLFSEHVSFQTGLQKGLYIYQLMKEDKKLSSGKMIIE